MSLADELREAARYLRAELSSGHGGAFRCHWSDLGLMLDAARLDRSAEAASQPETRTALDAARAVRVDHA